MNHGNELSTRHSTNKIYWPTAICLIFSASLTINPVSPRPLPTGHSSRCVHEYQYIVRKMSTKF